MKLESAISYTGNLHIVLRGPDGRIKDERRIKNLVVDAGKQFMARRGISATDAAMSHMAVGTGTAAAAASDTALATELTRVTLTSSVTDRTIQHVASYPAGTATGALTEAGIFNAAAAGTMLARTVFAVLNKAADDSMSITWNVTAN